MKKNLIIFICILVIVFAGLFFFFKSKLDTISKPAEVPEVIQSTESILNNIVGVKDCHLYKDTASVAVSKDIKKCDCLPVESRKQCKDYMVDEMFYNQAYYQLDASLCANISYETGRIACVKLVNETISSSKQNGPDDLLLTYIASGNYDGAIKILEGILQKEQTTSKYYNMLAQSYAVKALYEYKEAEYIPKAIDQIEKAKKIEPNNPEVYVTEGYVYEIMPDINKAIESYSKAITIDANNIFAYANRGHAKEMLGDIVGARADFDKAATLDKDKKSIFVYSNLCRINLYSNSYEASIKNCSIVIESNFANSVEKSEAHQILGSIYSSLKKYDEAWTQFIIAETYAPNNVNLILSISDMLLSKGDPIKAEEYSRKAIVLDSKRAIPYEKLAAALMSQSKNEEAITNALKALSLVEDDVSILLTYKKDVNFRIYSILVQVYKQIGDTLNQSKYEVLRDSLNK